MVWAVENTTPAVLHACDAGNLHELYNISNQAGSRDQLGAGNKFITSTIVNGKIYVGTTNSVEVFGLAALAFWVISVLNFNAEKAAREQGAAFFPASTAPTY